MSANKSNVMFGSTFKKTNKKPKPVPISSVSEKSNVKSIEPDLDDADDTLRKGLRNISTTQEFLTDFSYFKTTKVDPEHKVNKTSMATYKGINEALMKIASALDISLLELNTLIHLNFFESYKKDIKKAIAAKQKQNKYL